MRDEEKFKIHYPALNAEIIHYSNIRSALTTFLITVSIGTLVAYLRIKGGNGSESELVEKLLFFSHIFLFAATAVCLTFSYRTEKAILKKKALWSWAISDPGQDRPKYPDKSELNSTDIVAKMLADMMNWLLLIVVLAIFFNTKNL